MGVIAAMGISLLVPKVQVWSEQLFARMQRFVPRPKNGGGFFGGLIVGVSLGFLWTPCVGPILASVITLAATSEVTAQSVVITLAYSIGTAIPMFMILRFGQNLFQKRWLLSRLGVIQKVFGIVLVLLAVAMYFQLDRVFQVQLLRIFPQYGAGLTRIEQLSFVQDRLVGESGRRASAGSDLLPVGDLAPDFSGGGPWINSEPLSLRQDLSGKVVLVDFWTYSCINCIRTFPFLRDWHEKYADQGLVIVGVHSPEFAFEKELVNVQRAVQDFDLKYPVVLDNDFAIWRAYENQFWPAHYLIDQSGNIRYVHFGEGKYQETENAIRKLLGLEELVSGSEKLQENVGRFSPEMYLGWGREEFYDRSQTLPIEQRGELVLPEELERNEIGLGGAWILRNQYAQAQGDSVMAVVFEGAEVNMVLEPDEATDSPASARGDRAYTVKVLLDGRPVPSEWRGEDLGEDGAIIIDTSRRYQLVRLPEIGVHRLNLEFSDGVKAYTFTFGR